MRIVSKRPTMKHANEHANGTRPVRARPAAMPTMFDSAIPRLKARSGNFFAKPAVIVDFERSASSVTMRSSVAPSSMSASPNAARLALAAIAPPLIWGFDARGARRAVRGSLPLERAQLGDDGGSGGVVPEMLVPDIGRDREDFSDGGDRLRGLGRLAMPLGIVLHERHALAFHRVRDDQRGCARRRLGLIERLADLRSVVAVDLDHRPAKRLPLTDDRLEIED